MSRLIESTLAGKISNILLESDSKFCPRCGGKMSQFPATSRFDNKTEICSDCGTDEAMMNYVSMDLYDPHRYDPQTGKKLQECGGIEEDKRGNEDKELTETGKFDKVVDFMIDYDPYEFRNAYDGDDSEKRAKLLRDTENAPDAARQYLQDIIDDENTDGEVREKAQELIKVFECDKLQEGASGEEYKLEHADSDKISELEKGSALTWEGMTVDDANLKSIVEFFKKNTKGFKTPVTMYTWTGKEFNEKYGLTGNNAYPEDLSFLSIPLDAWSEMGNLPMVKMQVGARWLDDIVDNNARRQRGMNENAKSSNKVFECDKTLKEDSYEEPFFQEIEDALVNAGFDVDRFSDMGVLTKNLGWYVSNSEGEVQLQCNGTYLDECGNLEGSEKPKKLKEAYDFYELESQVKDAVYAAFEGSDFTVSGVSLGDNGKITFNVTAYGAEDEEGNTEMSREVELEVPELNYLDAVTNAVTDWMVEHNGPDSFYESAELQHASIKDGVAHFEYRTDDGKGEINLNVPEDNLSAALDAFDKWCEENHLCEGSIKKGNESIDELKLHLKDLKQIIDEEGSVDETLLKEKINAMIDLLDDYKAQMNDSLKESAEGITEFWNKFDNGEIKIGDTFGKLKLLDANKEKDYILVDKGYEFVAAWAPELSGENLVWGQGHYFDKLEDAKAYFNEKLNESVTVATGDGSNVSTSGAASVESNDDCVIVQTGDTTVVINKDASGEIMPDAPAVEELPQEEPVEEVPTDEIVPEEPVDGEVENVEEVVEAEDPIKDDVKNDLGIEPGSDEEEQLDALYDETDEDVVDAKSLAVIKNQGNVFMIQLDNSDLYYVCEDFDTEANVGSNASFYNNKEDADKDYFERVGLESDESESPDEFEVTGFDKEKELERLHSGE